MVLIKTAPYGEWKSPITAESVTAHSPVLGSPRVCPVTGRAFFLETRIDGSTSIMEITGDGAKNVLPDEYNADIRAYGEGIAPYTVVPGEELRIVFSDAQNQSLNILHVDSGIIERIQKVPSTLHFSDFDCYPGISTGSRSASWVLAVQASCDRVDFGSVDCRIVAINLVTKEIVSLVRGTDFSSSPRFSPDGLQICWLQRSNAGQSTQLYRAQFNSETGSISEARPTAGNDVDSISEPQWSPEGDLWFTSTESGVRQLSRFCTVTKTRERISLPGFDNANFGSASPAASSSSYIFLTDSILQATAYLPDDPVPQLIYIDLVAQTCRTLAPPSDAHLDYLPHDALATLSANSFLAIGAASETSPFAIHRINILDDMSEETTVLYSEPAVDGVSERYISQPQSLTFTTLREPRREVSGWFYAPMNPRFLGVEGEAPPLVVGLPSSESAWDEVEADMKVQFLTSRGFAYFLLDPPVEGAGVGDDVAEAVEFLGWSGRVDRARVGVEGEEASVRSVMAAMIAKGVLVGGLGWGGPEGQEETLVGGVPLLAVDRRVGGVAVLLKREWWWRKMLGQRAN